MRCSGGRAVKGKKNGGERREKQEEKMEGGRPLLGNKGGKMRENEGKLGSSARGTVGKLSQKKGEKMGGSKVEAV